MTYLYGVYSRMSKRYFATFSTDREAIEYIKNHPRKNAEVFVVNIIEIENK